MSKWIRKLIKKNVVLCSVCGVNPLPETPCILRLDLQDGTMDVKVCGECADFFDKSAQVLSKGRIEGDDDE